MTDSDLLLILGLLFVGAVVYAILKSKGGEKKKALSVLPEHFIVFDLETTGLDPLKHEILEIGAIKVNRDSDNHTTWQALVKPTKKIPKKITNMTGITQEMVESGGEELGDAIKGFKDFIGDLRLVSYNAEFDMGFINEAAKKLGVTINNPTSCALEMARRAYPGRRSYRLADFARDGGLDVSGNHRALKDAELALIVYAGAASRLNKQS